MSGKIILIIGGAKSGKTSLAMKMAKEPVTKGNGGTIVYLATGEARDSEMKRRINIHKKSRPKNWKTIEEPIDIISAVQKEVKKKQTIILDCITLWLNNIIAKKNISEDTIIKKLKTFIKVCKEGNSTIIIVSNEVGLGIVPENKLARYFRDIAGNVNQIIAKYADNVYLTVAGIPIKLK